MTGRAPSRRAALGALGSVALAATAPRLLSQTRPTPAASPADAWPQFRGSPRLTGQSASALPASPRLLWSHEAGDVVDSSAAIAGGVAYVAVGDGRLTALDLTTGTVRWRYTAGTIFGESSPAVVGDLVYVGDLDGLVHAVNVSTGAKVWSFKATGEIKASPIVSSGVLLIGSYDGFLYALDARTGALRWKVETKGPVHATLAELGPHVFVAGCDAIFRAIRVTDGRQTYQIDVGAYVGASPVVDGDRAYFGTYENEVMALDLARRRVLWRYTDPQRQFPFYSSAALSRGRVIIGGRDKHVYSIDASSGKAVWAFATRARVDSSPVVAGGRVYIGSSDGTLYGLDEGTGQRAWSFDAGDAITASPAIASSRLVIGARNGVVYCFG